MLKESKQIRDENGLTLRDIAMGRESSIYSPGSIGIFNKLLATFFRQEDADLKAFVNFIKKSNLPD